MKIEVILSGSGGELDRRELYYDAEDDGAEVSSAIQDVIEGWVLSPGDTIKITEAEDAR